MTTQELDKILSNALALPAENEVIEFKEGGAGFSFNEIGQYFSALSNEANLRGKPYAWLIFGVENKKHKIVGSPYRKERKGLDSLKKELGERLTGNISFIEIYELQKPEGRVIMFQIPSAPKGIPIEFNGFYYARANESLVGLNIEKIDRIRNQSRNYDWSSEIIPNATFDDLDPEAILKAREFYKEKHLALADEVDGWSDVTFLNKAKVTLNGKITNTAILLLGKAESGYLLSPAVAHITWLLKEGQSGYAHFNTPFILTVQKTLDCIRNLQYSYMVGQDSLFPKVVSRYDSWAIRELLNNCVAHQDYSRSSRIIVEEYNNRLVFRNAGRFIPESVEEVIRHDSPQEYYRNPFLTDAMVNLNMIETIGSGIKKIFTIQRSRFFPMPTYDFSKENSTIVTIYGELINENYTSILGANPNLSMGDVIALDKVQKKLPLNEVEIQRLRELKLVKGKVTSLQIVGATNDLTGKDYKQMILTLLTEKGSASREDVEKLLIPILPQNWTLTQQRKKVSNLLTILSSKDGKIKNISQSDKYPVYEIKKS